MPAGLADASASSAPASVSALPGRSQLDRDLMHRVAQQADRAAFSELAGHYAPRLKAWLMHRGEESATAEDIVQDVFVSVWRKADQYNARKASFSTWVFQITRNRWLDHKRKHARLDVTAPEDLSILADEPVEPIYCPLERSEAARAVRLAMSTLPPEQKQMLYLAFFEGLSHSAIAARTGIAIGTVKSRIRAPMKKLRGMLEEYRENQA